MRIAIISDIHANLVALDAVLADIGREGIEPAVCLGDVAGGGPQPREVLDRLRGLGCPVVQGNVDAWVLDPQPYGSGGEDMARMEAIDSWCAAILSDSDREYIRTFDVTVELPLEGGRTLLCFHGTQRSNREIILAETPARELAEKLGDRRADVMAGGHTHQQMLRRLETSIVMNPGSVGLPYEYLPEGGSHNPAWAEYAVLRSEGAALAIELRRLPVDVNAVRAAILSSGMPHAEWWASIWS